MIEAEVEFGAKPELTAEMVRAQLDLLLRDEVFRSSKRSIAFLKYVVDHALSGRADEIKERSIGIEVFGRDPSYDTNGDHIVRTAAAELRKRLATYYVDERHRSELRMSLVPGSYIPKFMLPGQARSAATDPGIEDMGANGTLEIHRPRVQIDVVPFPGDEHEQKKAANGKKHRYWAWILAVVAGIALVFGYIGLHQDRPEDLFWGPILETPGPVLVVVGDHPNGPPTVPETSTSANPPVPVTRSDFSQTVPFADTVTVARDRKSVV